MLRQRMVPYYFLLAGVLLQGLSPVLTKLLLEYVSPSAVVSTRYLIAIFFLLPFGWRHTPVECAYGKPRRRDWVALFLVGALGSGLAALLFTFAISYTTAGVATSLSKTAPIFVAFMAYFALREAITYGRILLVVGMVGGALLIGAGELAHGPLAGQRLLGDVLALGAGLLRAVAEVLGKNSLKRFLPSTVALWRFGVGFAVTGIIVLFSGGFYDLFNLDTRGWIIMGVLGALCTSLSMSLYYRGLRDIPAHVGVSLRLLSAIVTVVVSWWILHEALNAYHLLGISVLVAGAYVMVMRTTRSAASIPLTPPAPGILQQTTQTLRGRVALFVAVMIMVTVMGATLLSVAQNRVIVNEQVRLTMVKVGTIVLQLQGIPRPPDPETYRQYLDRVVNHRLEGRLYSIEILYICVLDARGDLIAYATRDEIAIRDPYERLLPAYSAAAGLRLLELADSGALDKRYDMIRLTAELETRGDVAGVVKIGFRRSIAQRTATEIAIRNLVLALLMIVLGVFISYHLVGYLARPLETLASSVRRISQGELEVPLVTSGGREIESLGGSVSRMAKELRMTRLLRQYLQQGLFGDEQKRTAESANTLLLARLGSDEETPGPLRLDYFLSCLVRNEGRLGTFSQGTVVAVWGQDALEQDDVLRAVITALEWRAAFQLDTECEEQPVLLVSIASGVTHWSRQVEEATGQLAQLPPGLESGVFLTEEAYNAIEPHFTADKVPGCDFRVVPADALGPLENMNGQYMD